MTLSSLLERLEAPEKLLVWASSTDQEGAWSACVRGDWMVWVAACSRVPVRPLLQAACDCVLEAVLAMSAGTEPLTRAVELARLAGPAKECRAAAKRCDQAAAAIPANYRSAVAPGYRAAARAAAWVARASDGLSTAEVRAETRAWEKAHQYSIGMNIIAHATLSKHPRAMRVDGSAAPDDPAQEQIAYAVAAAAQALAQAAIALAPRKEDRGQRREVRARFAQTLRLQLDTQRPRQKRSP